MIFTTSWDDGHPLDLRVAALLRKYGMTGTFYIAKRHPRVPVAMTDAELKELSEGMEIGAHTLTHPILTDVSPQQAEEEIRGSKTWLEDILGQPVGMFCYPRGEWNETVRRLVEQSGFTGARTTEVYAFDGNDPYLLGSTLHLYHFPFRPIANRRFMDPVRRAWPHLKELGIGLGAYRSWGAMARAVFRGAYERNEPWFHLRGHSWELENLGLWNELEEFLAFVASFENMTHSPNGALVKQG